MRKAILFVTILLLLSACTTAGGAQHPPDKQEAEAGSGAEAKVSGRLTVSTHRVDLVEDGTFDRYADAFQKRYPEVQEVVFEPIVNYERDIRVRLTTGDAGDVLLIPGNIAQVNLGDFFENLNDTAEGLGELYFKYYKSYLGNVYGIVSGVSTEGIIYNKKAFARAGITAPPRTLEELYAACEKLKRAGITPFYINYGAQWPMKQWGEVLVTMMSGRGSYLDSMITTDEPFRTDNEFGRSLTILRTLMGRGYVEADLQSNRWEASKGEFAQGNVGMFFMGNWMIRQLEQAGTAPQDIGYIPFPYDNSGTYHALMNTDWFYAVSKNSRNKEAAKAWIRFMIEESGYAELSGFIPPQKKRRPELPQLEEFFSYGPAVFENAPSSPLWYAIGNKAKIDFYRGEYLQRAAVAESLPEAFAKLNASWKANRLRVLEARSGGR
ncbi:family 1 extracellular solute-binding protein [Paenibacillus mucilaginosus 3016]|uniref:Family 1 extracellular solute-binding protein n=2 Tax=Paenibacillus mucilaginosus TaxID=61624 RepID=H6NKZ0_9BACL|nr:ABC transporter substrate-binding protein [Paenibacillus mucilaginosus]AFC29296.1 family 1 extracellular solute-binding protein [Paenibacillus mucilaginosus 3016]AFH61475.1 ABC transporter substrate-binding protein [Paenibacillus mucilaginosus K02]WFA18019.1 carbohydrate ABC transporter substrate-binding protein [Paenibacillus mucilaginosus]